LVRALLCGGGHDFLLGNSQASLRVLAPRDVTEIIRLSNLRVGVKEDRDCRRAEDERLVLRRPPGPEQK
jgi:hypothetical protein